MGILKHLISFLEKIREKFVQVLDNSSATFGIVKTEGSSFCDFVDLTSGQKEFYNESAFQIFKLNLFKLCELLD